MVTYDEYLRSVLNEIIKSYRVLSELKDKPGDLDIIRIELLKLNGLFQALGNKLGNDKFQSDELITLKSKIQHYLNNYSFEREIETMLPLYSDDPNRIKNIRLKILEALEDKKLTTKIETILQNL